MNPLQEYPHLFANGKFKFMYGDCACTLVELDITDGSPLLLYDGVESFWANLENSTLIARPIEDMTNKEFFSVQEDMSVLDLLQKEEFIKVLSEQTETEDGLGLRWVKCLGDWGMYFGPQSHFEDGTVIDSTTL